MATERLHWIRKGIAAMFLAFAIVAGGCATAPEPPPPDVNRLIETARTRADHEQLAAYYESESKRAANAVARHRSMRQYYQYQSIRGGAGPGLVAHCDNLIRSYQQAADEYAAMATAHRQLASQAKE